MNILNELIENKENRRRELDLILQLGTREVELDTIIERKNNDRTTLATIRPCMQDEKEMKPKM